MQILSRASLERNVSTLHRAGADFVMSFSSLGANVILNFLQNEDTWMLAEGLNIFRMSVPPALIGVELAHSGIRETTNCSVVAIRDGGVLEINPDPETTLREGAELILVGAYEGERKFLKSFES
jgi:Trk K+ transport system NAD-binding subunit